MGYLHIILCKKMFCAKKVTKLPELTVLSFIGGVHIGARALHVLNFIWFS